MRELIEREIGRAVLLEADDARAFALNGHAPGAVVAPRTAAEAAALLQLATREQFTVECAGAGSRLNAGNPPRNVDVVMTTARMTAIAEYEPADLVVSVASGVTFPQLDQTVGADNLFLALDPAVGARSTIGAAIATASAGPLRFAHGTPRDQVLGLEVVTGDGRVLNFGGRVVKNVAGYDVVRLIVGSRGTLGFITRVNLRLKPRPSVDATALVRADSLAQISDYARRLLAAHLDVAALELVSPGLAVNVTGGGQWTLAARLHGNAPLVEDLVSNIVSLCAPAAVEITEGSCWHALTHAESSAVVKLRFANLPSLMEETTAHALRAAQAAGLEHARVAAHVGDGIVRVLADSAPSQAGELFLAERTLLEAAGGSLIIERMPGADVAAFGHAAGAALMAQIKRVFDPADALGLNGFVI